MARKPQRQSSSPASAKAPEGMEAIESVNVVMAASAADVIARFQEVNADPQWRRVEALPEMREGVPIAIVGGGPSLSRTWRELHGFKRTMVCGSAHDYLVGLGIEPTWAVISDPDPIMAWYLRKSSPKTRYLVASHCAPEVFAMLEDRDVAIWNCGDTAIDSEKWKGQGFVFGGGCTVLSRAIFIAGCFGFWEMHFYGCDTSVEEGGQHHAYDFLTKEEEATVNDSVPVTLREGGEVFQVPRYLLGQIVDLKSMIAGNARRIRVRVHGGGLFGAMMDEAARQAGAARAVSERLKQEGTSEKE